MLICIKKINWVEQYEGNPFFVRVNLTVWLNRKEQTVERIFHKNEWKRVLGDMMYEG